MFESLVRFFASSPLLLLFAVVALGYPISRIRIAGAGLGIASILFAGIALGALDPRLKLPELTYLLGLAIFVYAIGLSSAQSFWGSFNRRGLRRNLLVAGVMVASTALVAGLALGLGFTPRMAAGLLTGCFTNSPALAGVIEKVKAAGGTPDLLAEPVVAYSIAYPIGVLVPMLAVLLAQRFAAGRPPVAEPAAPEERRGLPRLEVRSVLVTHPEVVNLTKHFVCEKAGIQVVFGRILRDGAYFLPKADTALRLGDTVVVVGSAVGVERATALMGEAAEVEIQRETTEFDSTRIFVSNSAVIGRPLRELDLPGRHQAVISRLRRGDLWFVPHSETVLELGDRIRVVTRRENKEAIEEYFGDSYRALSEADFLTFSLGLAAGLALGMLPIVLPGGFTFRLGFAGGPLVMALILGKVHRLGPFVWDFPYAANLTIRQFGLVLFAAGIGTIAGEGFGRTLASGFRLPLLLGAAALLVAGVADALCLVVGARFLKLPFGELYGLLAGMHTQPVVLGFASERTGDDLPGVGYATVYPLATVLKIVLAQLLLGLAG
ncbi:MAG: transporter [Holophagaceae bacterium]|nr:transporter [Holophagaceae bacterium]